MTFIFRVLKYESSGFFISLLHNLGKQLIQG